MPRIQACPENAEVWKWVARRLARARNAGILRKKLIEFTQFGGGDDFSRL